MSSRKKIGARRIDITVHVEFPPRGESWTPRGLLVFLVVLATAVIAVAVTGDVPGGLAIWESIVRLAGLISG